ncbi:hypothetical protein EVAR_76894_1 [Eumeta japonica]|uniref:Uncharacterized protein n=1 Tax=Eumeta variegata TaxID=151549 RepID=A0A4C1SHL8_EUMVA|nr:hypothetical protein EVAR_76894_1 [Eumeta japonica]
MSMGGGDRLFSAVKYNSIRRALSSRRRADRRRPDDGGAACTSTSPSTKIVERPAAARPGDRDSRRRSESAETSRAGSIYNTAVPHAAHGYYCTRHRDGTRLQPSASLPLL